MLTLNLTNVDKSDIKYSISRFPDGEVQITLGEFTSKDTIQVLCRITNAEELFLVRQVFDILDRNEMVYDVYVGYLMGMRMDRVMDFHRPFTLKIVADILKSCKAREFEILEAHSGRALHEFNTYDKRWPIDMGLFHGHQLVIPDAGAKERYDAVFSFGFDPDTIFCSKVRDVESGKILGIQIDNPEKISDRRPMLIIDDLCDGGGTFLGIAAAIRTVNPNAKLNIKVVHAVNKAGILRLSETFDHVYITNSYKDWQKEMGDEFPTNVTQTDAYEL